MTICYDIRFPALYRALAHAGAGMITAPAAFTQVTGQAHWHVLQRARAIENGAFIISAAQTGTHAEGRQTYGHSVIVAPWGEVADAGEAPGVITAEIDLAKSPKRAAIPSLSHDRLHRPTIGERRQWPPANGPARHPAGRHPWLLSGHPLPPTVKA